MPSANNPDPTSTSASYPRETRQTQTSQVPQGTQGPARASSNPSSSQRLRDADNAREERRSKGSNSDHEGEGPAGPPPPDKQPPKHREKKDGHNEESQRSSSPVSLSGFEHIAPFVQIEVQERNRTVHTSRSSTADESRPPGLDHPKPLSTAPNQVGVTPEGLRPGKTDSRRSMASGGMQSKPGAQQSGQPPQGPTDNRPSKGSYATVVGDPAKGTMGPVPSGPPDRRPVTSEEDVDDLDDQLPGAFFDEDIVSQEMQQVENTQQPQPQQGRETPGYGLIGNAIRSFMPVGGPSPPRDRTKEELQNAIREIHRLRGENKRGREEYRGLRQAFHEVDHERVRLKDNNSSLQHELSNVRRELEESKALSETRGRELIGAQVFLTKADSLSISDVIDKVGVLNEEIFQAAASLGETIVHTKRELSHEYMQRSCEQACFSIGKPLVKSLIEQAQKPEPQVNPLIVQAVLSIFLVRFCVTKLESWYPGDKALAEFLGSLYSEIRISEEQAVSGRWRALTRSRTRPTSENWMAEISEKLGEVLVVAFWDSPKDHFSAFQQKLLPIFKAVEDLRIALGEKFTSADIEINTVISSSKFESWMEDAYGDGRQAGGNRSSQEIVVGTTGIGLKKVIVNKGQRDERERFENVLPPKVFLESTLREALDPPPPARKPKKKKVEQEDGGNGGNGGA